MNRYDPNDFVSKNDFEDLVDLIGIRPDSESKIGVGIDAIRVITIRHKTRCFELIRKDKTSEVFSYIKCINGQSNPLSKFSKTCRETVIEDLRNVKLGYFKKHSVKGKVKCQETGELCKWEELNVDHRQPNTFSVIVDRFIEVNQIDLTQIQYLEVVDAVYNFSDLDLTKNFRSYHKDKANLRIIMKGKNLGRSHLGRNTRQQKDLTIE